MTRYFVVLAILGMILIAHTAHAQDRLTGHVNLDGKVVLSAPDGPIQAGSLDFISAGGYLVPVPESVAASDFFALGKGFAIYLANTNQQITLINLGTTTTIEGELVTPIGYDLSKGRPLIDLTAAWGNGPERVNFAVPFVPEPAAGVLAMIGILGLLGFRCRR